MKTLFFVLLSLTLFTKTVVAQPPPPATGNADSKPYQKPSLANLSPSEKFSSAMGRFTISLPKSINGYAAIYPQIAGSNVKGDNYQWKLKEGGIIVSYLDYLDGSFNVKTDEDFNKFFAFESDEILRGLGATISNVSRIVIGNYKGVKVDFTLPSGIKGTRRKFLVDKRQYSLTAFFDKDISDAEKLMNQAFDSFTLTTQAMIDEALRRQLDEANAQKLPQEPAIKKEKSDVQDDGLKGKVKSVTQENEDVLESGKLSERKTSVVTEYNEKSGKLREIFYDFRGNPFDVSVYGYIDGARVEKSKSISHEYDPPPPPAPTLTDAENKRDYRYQYKYEYQYKNGKLTEERHFGNDNSGKVLSRYVYNYQDNQMEELVYSGDKLNQKYLTIFDNKGNELEKTDFDLIQPQIYGDRKSQFVYNSFDERGNWTKRTINFTEIKDGKKTAESSYIEYRTITYYQ